MFVLSSRNDSASTAYSAAAGEGGGARDPADVWEFTEGDLDNIGGGATTYGSDDEWSYASVRERTPLHGVKAELYNHGIGAYGKKVSRTIIIHEAAPAHPKSGQNKKKLRFPHRRCTSNIFERLWSVTEVTTCRIRLFVRFVRENRNAFIPWSMCFLRLGCGGAGYQVRPGRCR